MTPPRSDNWSGCVGLLVALLAYHLLTGNRAALRLTLVGMLAGGVGFAVADWVNVLGRGQWGPIGSYEPLQRLDYWKWMEQLFGLLMGLGVAWGFGRAAAKLASQAEDERGGLLRYVALVFLLVVMMWENLFKNVRTWAQQANIREGAFGVEPQSWFLAVGIGLAACVILAVFRLRRDALPLVPASAFGRAQLLFLLVLWVPIIAAFMQAFPTMHTRGVLFVHSTFWLTGIACTLIVVALPEPTAASISLPVSPEARSCLPGWKHGVAWLAALALVVCLAWLAIASHEEPLWGSHLRF
jgi:hypothetical protein